MPYTPVRDIELIEIGSLGKETLSNDAFVNLSRGISGNVTIPLTGTAYTLTAEEAQAFVLILTGVLSANLSLTVPAVSRVFIVDNRTTGAFDVSIFPSAGGGVAAIQGERTLVYCDGANVYPVASGSGGGGGSGAPTDASYLVGAGHALLSGERVVTDTAQIVWNLGIPGQVTAVIAADAITFAEMQPIASGKLLGRFSAGDGDIQLINLSTGLTLDGAGNLAVTSSGGQPADATLDALAALVTVADRMIYFTGVDAAALTTLTAFARTLLDDADAAAVRATLALTPGTNVQAQDATLQAIAGLTPGANQMIFFTATDAASTTQITTFARSLLDDNNANQARQTLGITATGAPSIPFTALLDVPTSYTGQGGKTVAVKADQTGLEFITGASGSQPLDATLTALAGLATAVDTVPLFVGTDLASLMTVTAFARTLLDDLTAAAARITLGLVPGVDVQPLDPTLTALAGVTTGVDLLAFFTGDDTANSTVLTGFARTLLDDDDAAEMRATLGISGTGGSTDFLGLTDTPDAYATHGGKVVAVKADVTGLEFVTAVTGAQPYDLGLSWSGVLPASQVLMRYPFPRAADFPAGLTNSRGVAAVAATGSTTLDIQKNGTSVGSAVFAAAGTTATFTMASLTSFAAGDILTIVAPASADATLADLGLALAGTRV